MTYRTFPHTSLQAMGYARIRERRDTMQIFTATAIHDELDPVTVVGTSSEQAHRRLKEELETIAKAMSLADDWAEEWELLPAREHTL